MDPDVALRALRALAAKVLRDYENGEGAGIDDDDACALAQRFADLDEWLSRGGFLPQPWAKRGS
jgi:hypothetical protein